MAIPKNNAPCPCGNVDREGHPVLFYKCCGDKPQKDKLYSSPHLTRWINANLQMMQFLFNKHLPRNIYFPNVNMTVERKYLSSDQCEFLFSKGIPVYHPQSTFFFIYAKMADKLASSVNKNAFFGGLVDILYNELAINQRSENYLRLLPGIEAGKGKRKEMNKKIAEWTSKEEEKKVSPRQVKEESVFMSIPVVQGKWELDSAAVKIRAVWDKLLYLISEKYFGIKLSAKSLGENKSSGRIGEFLRKTKGKTKNKHQEQFIESFVNLLLDLKWLRKYRDLELHFYGVKIKNGFQTKNEAESIEAVWEKIKEEHNKLREGILLALGIALS